MAEQLLEARTHYEKAQKAALKYYRGAVARGLYPYPPVLDDMVEESQLAGRQDLGLMDIPAELIVGTKAAGRREAFAGNFMPLLEANTEFGGKWISLCAAHLDEGIRDPIKAFEYMGRFYVQEGNKRVSVLKSLDCPDVRGNVVRFVPAYSEDLSVQIYYEFMRFYPLSKLYLPRFSRLGSYAKLQAALGMEPDHVWTEEERRRFTSGYVRLRDALGKREPLPEGVTTGDILLSWLGIYPFSDLTKKTLPEIGKALDSLQKNVESLAHDKPIKVSTEPPKAEKSLSSALLGFVRAEHVSAAFIYPARPEDSRWITAHENGRLHLERVMGDAVTTRTYITSLESAQETMEAAVDDGCDVIFAVTPTLMDACRKTAALHPGVKILNCSLSGSYPGVRCYYSRMYETKFLAGAVAGAMCRGGSIGYVADYPIYGVPAAINAFVLGARSVDPEAHVLLRWSCMDDRPEDLLRQAGCRVISRQEAIDEPREDQDWSLYRLRHDNSFQPLASTGWAWGRYYTRVVRSILDGSYGSDKGYAAINYWWGLRSRVITLNLSDTLPDGLRRLVTTLQCDITDGHLEPFRCLLQDQTGKIRNDGSRGLTAEEIMRMDYLLDAVDGFIPGFDELRPESRHLVRHLGLYREYLPPEKEADKQL